MMKRVLALARNLEIQGYTVFTALDGQAGIKSFARERPDIIFVDVRMPGLDGFAVLEAIRAHEPHAEVVLMTGHGDKDTVIAALRADATDFVSKPIEREVLENVLRRAQERLRLKRELSAAQEALRASNAALERLVSARTAELEQERTLLRTLIDNIPVLITRYDHSGKLLYLNKAFQETLGWTTAEARDMDLLAAIYPDPDSRRQALEHMLQATGDWREFHALSKFGTLVDSLWSNIQLPDGSRVGIGIDITARKQAESALRESEKRYRLLTEGVSDVLWIFDVAANRFRYISPSAKQLSGYTPEELTQLDASAIYTPETLAYLAKVLPERIQAFEQGEDRDYRDEIEHLSKDGAHIWTEVTCHYYRNEDTGQLEVYGVSRDITRHKQLELERRQMVAALQESEARYRSIFNNIQEGVFQATSLGRLTTVNPALARILGYDSPEALLQLEEDLPQRHHLDAQKYAELQRQLCAYGYVKDYELAIRRLDGKNIWVTISVSIARGADGQALVYEGAVQDITERKVAELLHVQLADELEQIFHGAHAAMFLVEVVDATTFRYVRNNRAHQELTGFSPTALRHKTPQELLGEAAGNVVANNYRQCIASGKPVQYEEYLELSGGKRIWETRLTPVFTAGRPPYIVGSSEDITERRAAEQLHAQQARELQTLYEASQELKRTLDLEQIYTTVHRYLRQVLPCDGMYISDYDASSQLITCRAGWNMGLRMDVSGFPTLPLNAASQGTQSVAIRTGQSLLLNDYESYRASSQARYYIDAQGDVHEQIPDDAPRTRAALIVPLEVEGRVTGVIQVFSNTINAYSPEHLRLLEALAVHIAIALENAALYQAALEGVLIPRQRH